MYVERLNWSWRSSVINCTCLIDCHERIVYPSKSSVACQSSHGSILSECDTPSVFCWIKLLYCVTWSCSLHLCWPPDHPFYLETNFRDTLSSPETCVILSIYVIHVKKKKVYLQFHKSIVLSCCIMGFSNKQREKVPYEHNKKCKTQQSTKAAKHQFWDNLKMLLSTTEINLDYVLCW